ncbi:hypothetical protein PCYB_103830, partial [Plasmodium cynomolgi strain B]
GEIPISYQKNISQADGKYEHGNESDQLVEQAKKVNIKGVEKQGNQEEDEKELTDLFTPEEADAQMVNTSSGETQEKQDEEMVAEDLKGSQKDVSAGEEAAVDEATAQIDREEGKEGKPSEPSEEETVVGSKAESEAGDQDTNDTDDEHDDDGDDEEEEEEEEDEAQEGQEAEKAAEEDKDASPNGKQAQQGGCQGCPDIAKHFKSKEEFLKHLIKPIEEDKEHENGVSDLTKMLAHFFLQL